MAIVEWRLARYLCLAPCGEAGIGPEAVVDVWVGPGVGGYAIEATERREVACSLTQLVALHQARAPTRHYLREQHWLWHARQGL